MAETTTLVIFGASGDLTHRKLVPALFSLYRKNRLPEGFRLLGMARSLADSGSLRDQLHQAILEFGDQRLDEQAWAAFADKIDALRGDPTEADGLHALEAQLAANESTGGPANRLYYLAIPPHVYGEVVTTLGHAGMLNESAGWRRVVIEKPFGSDLPSAHALNNQIHQVLSERQVYRIDHYLGKETVQNVLVFRFANSIFEPVWNRNYIDHVQITVAETVGIEHRGQFYDRVGVLRDMFQNHLMQLLAMAAMEPPSSFDAEALRDERAKVLSAVRRIPPDQAAAHSVRGQYQGYCQEPGVAADSQTATFGAVRLFIDNWRWQGVPFYLRSGKALAEKVTGIVIHFKSVPHVMFPLPPGRDIRPNALELCIQPDEGMHLHFEVKVPGTVADMRSVDMDFHYAEDFGPGAIPEAYERLLLDALTGDASLFTRADSIELAWSLIDPIQQGWDGPNGPPLTTYPPGSMGPAEAQAFLAADGRQWSMGCGEHSD